MALLIQFLHALFVCFFFFPFLLFTDKSLKQFFCCVFFVVDRDHALTRRKVVRERSTVQGLHDNVATIRKAGRIISRLKLQMTLSLFICCSFLQKLPILWILTLFCFCLVVFLQLHEMH